MPEESKNNPDKKRNGPKEQRKPRNSRNQARKVERETDKIEVSKSAPKVTVPQKPPVYQEPGEEFYKNLKRETEDILKITEAENSKYKKKEIQSNWSKYEMPIESYEEIEGHDIGADYEKLIQAPLSVGGHFQFKHEKSWDVNTGPSLYDKYFDINMDNLSLAVSTIPFHERNAIDISLFSENDMLSMNNRATKYKQKYYNDKLYATPETEAQDRILYSLKESLSNNGDNAKLDTDSTKSEKYQDIVPDSIEETRSPKIDDIDLDLKNKQTDYVSSPIHNVRTKETKKPVDNKVTPKLNDIDLTLDTVPESKLLKDVKMEKLVNLPTEILERHINEAHLATNDIVEIATASKMTEKSLNAKITDQPVQTKKNPVIQSPEDLEKWLDDFLDG